MSGRVNGPYNTLKRKVYPEGAGSPPAASFLKLLVRPLLQVFLKLLDHPLLVQIKSNLLNHLET